MAFLFLRCQMKRNFIKHIAGFFFICLFIFNGLYSIFPSLFINDEPTIENVFNAETEKSNAEEKGEKALKEVYLNNIYPGELLSVIFSVTKILAAEQSMYKKDIHLSIPTPPPKFS